MSTVQDNKLITEEFLENAKNTDDSVDTTQERSDESEKMILDEVTNEKGPIPDLSNDPSGEGKSDENSEETESTRDQNSCERDDASELPQPDEWQDILGSGVLMKKVLKEGEPDTRPSKSDKCFINYTSRLEEADEEDCVEQVDNLELGLGEGDVIQGLDVAIALMNKKERCLLKIGSRLAYGEMGLPPKVPANASVIFDLELVDWQPEEDFDSLSVQARQEIGNKKRERGNWWYRRGENTLAVQCYRRALDYLDEVETDNSDHEKPTDGELQRLLEDRLKVLNNMASAQIKMELFDQALTSLQTVLRCQPDNVKALFRKAKIHSAKNDLPQALKLLEKARSLEPDDVLIVKEINAINGLINKQKNSEREYARRMFGGGSPSSTKANNETKSTERDGGSRGQIWATLGATLALGLAGLVAYKLKYF